MSWFEFEGDQKRDGLLFHSPFWGGSYKLLTRKIYIIQFKGSGACLGWFVTKGYPRCFFANYLNENMLGGQESLVSPGGNRIS